MRQIKAEMLSGDAFAPFGTYLDPGDCGRALDGVEGPIRFYPDRILLDLGGAPSAALSPLVIAPRELAIDITEIHEHTEEILGGFSGDVLFHAGPAGGPVPDPARFRVFLLPAGWWVRLKKGVWHHAPFALGREAVSGLVILPPATYARDCRVVKLHETAAVSISL